MVIEKVAKLLNKDESSNDWPADCKLNDNVRKRLSFSKLENEMAERYLMN